MLQLLEMMWPKKLLYLKNTYLEITFQLRYRQQCEKENTRRRRKCQLIVLPNCFRLNFLQLFLLPPICRSCYTNLHYSIWHRSSQKRLLSSGVTSTSLSLLANRHIQSNTPIITCRTSALSYCTCDLLLDWSQTFTDWCDEMRSFACALGYR